MCTQTKEFTLGLRIQARITHIYIYVYIYIYIYISSPRLSTEGGRRGANLPRQGEECRRLRNLPQQSTVRAIYVYIYIYRERERQRDRGRNI